MKTLSTFINEKLNLSNINEDGLDKWVPAKQLKYEDIQEGYILHLWDNSDFLVITGKFANKIEKSRIGKYDDNELVLIAPSLMEDGVCSYRLTRYKENYPHHDNLMGDNGKPYKLGGQRITKVLVRPKKYKNVEEIKQDLDKIDKDIF